MQQIKQTFGPDAVILSSNTVANGVEVVAAIDFDESVITQQAAVASAAPEPEARQSSSAKPATSLDDMREEIVTLRSMLEAQLRGGANNDPLRTVLMQRMTYLGMSFESAAKLIETIPTHVTQAQAWQQLLNTISKCITIKDGHRIEEGGIYAFVGPTGVGKTTTLAKIAARFVLRYGAENLGLISMDTYRIAAQEQLVVYGKIFGVDVYKAEDQTALTRVIKQLSGKKLILIDTAGMNPSDERMHVQMDALNIHHHSIATVITLPATSHYQVIIDAIRKYQTQNIDQCVITKLDECKAIGGILSALIETGMPVSYLTHGQRVPEDIKLATRYQLIEQLAEQEIHLFRDSLNESTTVQDA